MNERRWHLRDAAATRAAGFVLGKALRALPLAQALQVTLSGELGAGKTTLVGGLMAALGYTGVVRSPTYTLIEPYEFPDLLAYHMDLYRLTDPAQLEDLGLRDLLQPRTILLVEWAERGGGFFAQPDLRIELSYAQVKEGQAEQGRDLCMRAEDESLSALIDGLSF